MHDSLSSKVVLVTGAGRGIGRAIAERFAKAGSAVAVNDVDGQAAAATAGAISDGGGTATAVQADVSDSAQVGAMVDSIMAGHGRIDVLVNNAGIVSPTRHFFEATEEWWRRIVDVNLTGHFLVSHPVARIMAKQGGGSIINMSSGGATRAHRSFTAYDATKGGIEALTRAMALDLGPYNVRVNALVPGAIDTSGMAADERALRGENVPLGRVGEPPGPDRSGAVPGLRRRLLHHWRDAASGRWDAGPAALGHRRHRPAGNLPRRRGPVTMERAAAGGEYRGTGRS